MGNRSIVTLFFVVMVFVVGVNAQTEAQLKECVVDILDKSFQPEYQQNPCLLAEVSAVCLLRYVVGNFDLPESAIQAMQTQFDAKPELRDCNLNVRELIEKAKKSSQTTNDEDQSPESVARREALKVCVDDLFAKAQRIEYEQDKCRLTRELIPCLVQAISPNGTTSEEMVQGIQVGINSQDSNNCNIDVRQILIDDGILSADGDRAIDVNSTDPVIDDKVPSADDKVPAGDDQLQTGDGTILAGDGKGRPDGDGNAAPTSFSGSFWGTLVISSLSVLLLARGY